MWSVWRPSLGLRATRVTVEEAWYQLLNIIYKGPKGGILEVMAASVFYNLLGNLSIWA